jgi:hypothetical protein
MPATKHRHPLTETPEVTLLPNGLHQDTIDFMLIAFEAMRDHEKNTVAKVIREVGGVEAIDDEEAPAELVEACERLAVLSAYSEVIEVLARAPPETVKDGLEDRSRVFEKRKTERAGTTRIIEINLGQPAKSH